MKHLNRLKNAVIGCAIIGVMFFASGCFKEESLEPTLLTTGTVSRELEGLLPEVEGAKWEYYGTADYGQQMTITKVYSNDTQKIIKVAGEVADLSDGESSLDYSIALTYKIEADRVIQLKLSDAMMDSEYDQLTLIMAPLEVGTKWTESVIDSQGKKVQLVGEIIEYEQDPEGDIYKILYAEKGSDYSEVRKIQVGKGVIDFLKTMKYQNATMDVGYHLYKLTLPEATSQSDEESSEVNTIKGVLYKFDESWMSFVNSGSNEIYDYILEGSAAHQMVKGFVPNGKKQKFDANDIKSVQVNGDEAHAWVYEKLKQETENSVEILEYHWVYKLVKKGEQWYVDSFVEDGAQ